MSFSYLCLWLFVSSSFSLLLMVFSTCRPVLSFLRFSVCPSSRLFVFSSLPLFVASSFRLVVSSSLFPFFFFRLLQPLAHSDDFDTIDHLEEEKRWSMLMELKGDNVEKFLFFVDLCWSMLMELKGDNVQKFFLFFISTGTNLQTHPPYLTGTYNFTLNFFFIIMIC